MRGRALFHASLGALVFCTPAIGQTPPSEIDTHIAAAKSAAGLDYRATFVNLCFPNPPPGGARGALGLLAPRPAPDPATWYASPYQVFDNLYWLGTRQHSSWALRTSAGIIIIDTNFAWATQPEILDGMSKLKLDPKDIKYVVLSHAHGDHDQGVATLQKNYGAKVVMGGPDWEATLKRAPDVAGGVPTRGPDDIAVGPEGYKLTLGDSTMEIVFTPGHSVGTLSYIFPVMDKGKRVMVAYSGGTLTGAFGTDGRRWDEYIDSQKRIAQAAATAGASVILSNHSEYDGAYTKARPYGGKTGSRRGQSLHCRLTKRAELFHGNAGMCHRLQTAKRRKLMAPAADGRRMLHYQQRQCLSPIAQ